MLSRKQRADWLLKYLKDRESSHGQSERVDILNRYFVEDYVDATKAPHHPMTMGADRCPMLAADLRRLFHAGLLQRQRSGIEGMGYGWPKWVWTYHLPRKELDHG